MPRLATQDLRRTGIGTFFRPRDIRPLGISYYALRRLVAEGAVESAGAGLYRLANVEATDLETIAMVASVVPKAVLCLLSALRVHDIGTQSPREVWLAIDRKARKPTRLPAPARFVRFSGQMARYGITERSLQGVNVRITSPARTVVDCFRYRNKIGLDVALEALRDAVRSHKARVGEIERAADVCRISTVIAPHLAALSV